MRTDKNAFSFSKFRIFAYGLCAVWTSAAFADTSSAPYGKEPDMVIDLSTATWLPWQFQENWLVAVDYDTTKLEIADGNPFSIVISDLDPMTYEETVLTNLVSTTAPAEGRAYFTVPSLSGGFSRNGYISFGNMPSQFEIIAAVPDTVYAYAPRSSGNHSFDDTATWTVGGKPATTCPGAGDTIWYSGYSGLSIERLVLEGHRKVASISVEGRSGMLEPLKIIGVISASTPLSNLIMETDALVCHSGTMPMVYIENCQLKINRRVDESFVVCLGGGSKLALPAGAKVNVRSISGEGISADMFSIPSGSELTLNLNGDYEGTVSVSGEPPAEDGTVSTVADAQSGTPVLKVHLAGETKDLRLAGEWINCLAGAEISAATFNATGKNGIPVWQSYVLGVDPREEKPVDEQISATITIKSDGTPEVSCRPNVSEDANRNAFVTYETYGKPDLDASSQWCKVTDENRASMRFFSVRISIK